MLDLFKGFEPTLLFVSYGINVTSITKVTNFIKNSNIFSSPNFLHIVDLQKYKNHWSQQHLFDFLTLSNKMTFNIIWTHFPSLPKYDKGYIFLVLQFTRNVSFFHSSVNPILIQNLLHRFSRHKLLFVNIWIISFTLFQA